MAIELCLARNPRIAVDAKLLEGNEVGPEVAFFESADLDAMLLRDRAGHPVNRPAIAEQQHDVDLPLFQETGEELRPVAGMATPGQRVGRIKQAVAAVEVDLVDLGAPRSQEFREPSEERPHGALQQQDLLGAQRVPAGVAHVTSITGSGWESKNRLDRGLTLLRPGPGVARSSRRPTKPDVVRNGGHE